MSNGRMLLGLISEETSLPGMHVALPFTSCIFFGKLLYFFAFWFHNL